MSRISIAKDSDKRTGLKPTVSLDNCGDCGSEKVTADMNKVPVIGTWFKQTLGKIRTEIRKPHTIVI